MSGTPKPKHQRRKRDERYKQQAFAILGGCCEVCGEDDPRCLTIDHRYGTDLKHNDNMRGGISLQRAIVAGRVDIDELQCLCSNHNLIKRLERGEHKGYRRGKE